MVVCCPPILGVAMADVPTRESVKQVLIPPTRACLLHLVQALQNLRRAPDVKEDLYLQDAFRSIEQARDSLVAYYHQQEQERTDIDVSSTE